MSDWKYGGFGGPCRTYEPGKLQYISLSPVYLHVMFAENSTDTRKTFWKEYLEATDENR